MQPSFFFYDYESFGINPAKDRLAQFAGVRTDLDLNPIGEPITLYCKPSNDFLPDPEAVLITGITPQHCLKHGLIEAEFCQQIHQEFSQPNTCVIGYNSIRFDDEFTRYLFYRNFYDPYAYSYKNGNSRWDLIDVVRACYALRPEGIEWPISQEGLVSFRLEELTRANHIEHTHAHDALSDVYATINMAKLIKQQKPKLFHYFYQLRLKKQVQQLINLQSLTPLVHTSGMFGSARANTSIIVPLLWHPTNSNAVITCDLMGDIEPLLTLSVDQLHSKLYAKSDELDENESRIPLKLIHTNKCPIVAPIKTLSQERAVEINIDFKRCEDNLQLIQSHYYEIKDKLTALYEIPYESTTPNKEVDAQLYDGFFDDNDRLICDTIRNTDPQNLANLTIEPSDQRILPLLFLYKARNYPQYLSDQEQREWQNYRMDKWPMATIQDYLMNLEQLALESQKDEHKIELLKQVYLYCQSIFS